MNDSKVSIVGNKAYIVEEIPFEYEFSENIEKIFVPEDSYNSYSESSLYVSVKEKLYPYNYGAITVNRPEFVKYAKGDYLLEKIYKNGGCLSPDYMTIAEYENNFITFEDTTVKSVIVSKFGSNNEITFKQAAQVTNEQLEGLFNGNTKVTKFNEFVFFTGITKVSISDNTDLSKTNSPFRLSSLQEITLPETVTELGYRAFDQCRSIRKIENLDCVTGFDYCCLQLCGTNSDYHYDKTLNIKKFNGKMAFNFSPIPTKVNICDGITTIPEQTFSSNPKYNINHLSYVSLPSTLKVIENGAFQYCTFKKIELPEGIEVLNHCFSECKQLEEINLPKSLREILQWSFSETKLKGTISIPDNDNLISIDYSSFYNCKNIKTIIIPDNITIIEEQAFSGCTGLEEIYVKATTPPTIKNVSAFTGVTAKIYVPKASVEAYKTANIWSGFADRIFGI